MGVGLQLRRQEGRLHRPHAGEGEDAGGGVGLQRQEGRLRRQGLHRPSRFRRFYPSRSPRNSISS